MMGQTLGGDAQTSVAVHDLPGQIVVQQVRGPGLNPRVSGEGGGSETVTLAGQQLGAHGHAFAVTSAVASTGTPSGSVTLGAAVGDAPYTTAPSGNPLAMSPASTPPDGGSQPHDHLMPTLAVHVFIATSVISPSRGCRAFRLCPGLHLTEPVTAAHNHFP